VDYDLHGLAGVRLLDASAPDVAAVDRQLGPIRRDLRREPDIVIRFVDALPVRSPLRYLGVDDVAWTDDAFLVLRSRHKSRARVQIPFQEIGRVCRIVCERGLAAVPLLIPILNFTVLARGALPLHAAAFTTAQGCGVVATGWSKGGKTETLLSFMAHGARYVGDEWVYLTGDGDRVYGIPEPIRLWKWHLDSMAQYRAAVPAADRARLRMLEGALAAARAATGGGSRHGTPIARSLNRLAPLLKNQLCVDVPPQRLFGADRCDMEGRADVTLFVGSHDDPSVAVRPVDPSEVARRMVFSLQEEQMRFMSFYWKFRFAFPDAACEIVDRCAAVQRRALERALRGRRAYTVGHPYPVSLGALYEALREVCR
jgi:hypothetical protein